MNDLLPDGGVGVVLIDNHVVPRPACPRCGAPVVVLYARLWGYRDRFIFTCCGGGVPLESNRVEPVLLDALAHIAERRLRELGSASTA